MKSLIRRSTGFPTLFDLDFSEPFLDTMHETFKILSSDFFSDNRKVSDVFQNQLQYPKTDITKTEKELRFEMVVPFCKKDDIEIQLENGILSVKYDKVSQKETKGGQCLRNEIRRSSFRRAWKIEEEITEDNISANMENGILTINVPFKEVKQIETTAKKIAIS